MLNWLQHHSGKFIAVSRSGELAVVDEHGRERERYKIPYGAEFSVTDGSKVETGQIVANWDPHSHPVITEVAGRIKFADLVESVTMNRQTDELTGLSSIVVTDPKQRGISGKELKPMIKLVDEKKVMIYIWLVRIFQHNISCHRMRSLILKMVQVLKWVTLLREFRKKHQKPATSRVVCHALLILFEARRPKDPAILAEISGVISFGKETKGKRRLIITMPTGEVHEELIPKWRHVSVFEGEHVEKGEVIAEGALNPHDILRLLGTSALANLYC